MSSYPYGQPHRCVVDCDRPLHWATEKYLRVLTLSEGKKFIAIHHCAGGGREVLLIRTDTGGGRTLGHFDTAKESLACASRAAHHHGLDYLAFDGGCRRGNAKATQIRALRYHKIEHRKGISCGEAGALIALGITKAFLNRRNSSHVDS